MLFLGQNAAESAGGGVQIFGPVFVSAWQPTEYFFAVDRFYYRSTPSFQGFS
jgi:hypothetical protein